MITNIGMLYYLSKTIQKANNTNYLIKNINYNLNYRIYEVTQLRILVILLHSNFFFR